MSNQLRYLFVTDGSSDKALMPILDWLLRENGVEVAIQGQWADLSRASLQKKTPFYKIYAALKLYSCDLLFIHRDAETETREKRVQEIRDAVAALKEKGVSMPPFVCVVPVRMQETWLLTDETAIRYASGNRSSDIPLDLPPISRLEDIPDPKNILHNNLKAASGLGTRRLKNFPISQRTRRIAEFTEDFSVLRNLSAFVALEDELRQVLQENFLSQD